jgi:hypothetical protein
MSVIYLTDGSNTLAIDDIFSSFSLGGVNKRLDFVDYAGADGGYIKGFGSYGSRKLILSRREKKASGDYTFFESAERITVNKWIGLNTELDLVIEDKNGYKYTTPCRILSAGSEKVSRLAITDIRDIEVILFKGVFEIDQKTTVSDSFLLGVEKSVTITPSYTADTPGVVTITADGSGTFVMVYLDSYFGFKLERSFIAGDIISYDMVNDILYFNGVSVDKGQFLTQGNLFSLPVSLGTFSVYVTADFDGDIDIEYYNRYV